MQSRDQRTAGMVEMKKRKEKGHQTISSKITLHADLIGQIEKVLN